MGLAPSGWQEVLRDVITPSVDDQFLAQMLVALALGALIGLERERHRLQGLVLAGIRTFPLVSMSGVILVRVAEALGADYLVAVGLGVFGLFALLFAYVRHTLNQTGFTSPITLFVTYLVGVLIGLGMMLEGIAAGVAAVVLLFTKERLHRLAEVMTEKELAGALQFIVLAFILFPLFRDEAIDPYGVVNPKQILLIVVFVSAISFVSFLAMRTFGARKGLEVSGVLGGLVNSEATTASVAGMAQREPAVLNPAAVAVLGASATMLVRNLLIAAFVEPSFGLVLGLLVPYALMLLVIAIPGVLWLRTPAPSEARVEVKNPFSIPEALRFAALFTLLHAFIVAMTLLPVRSEGAVYLAALGGMVSVAAIVASVGTLLADGRMDWDTAALITVLATAVSMATKLLIARSHSAILAARVKWPFLGSAVAGLAGVALAIALF